ncbi:MAG: DEAD/DEAH box helicase family protein [Parvibaculaceae bacterium]
MTNDTAHIERFVNEMERHWTEKLGNTSSAGFRQVWALMAETYNAAILKTLGRRPLQIFPPDWLVLSPEMGTGKTVGACLYLGLLARDLRTVSPPVRFGGVLVCRTIRQCEEAVSAINEHAGFPAAITRHSDNEVTIEQSKRHPILVITHAALVNTDDKHRHVQWDDYAHWDGGTRPLIIIDEALANAVEFQSINEQSLHFLLSRIPGSVKERHELAVDIISSFLDRLKHIGTTTDEAYTLWPPVPHGETNLSVKLPLLFKRLLEDLKTTGLAGRDRQWNDRAAHDADLKIIKATLDDIAALFRQWAVFAKKGKDATLMTARVRLPRDLWCPVLLNATAPQDVLLDHTGGRLIPMPKVRNYKNLTIHILRTSGLGKTEMIARQKERLSRVGQFVRDHWERDDQWMIVTHKDVEARAKLEFPDNCLTAHWGALDGLNDFKECNKAVLFGLSYKEPTTFAPLYFALRGYQPSDWFKSGEATKIKRKLQEKSLAAQVLQALGRPRSRRVVDEEGNCLPTTIYLTLPPDALGSYLEETIKTDFPDVTIKDWDFTLDGDDVTTDARREVSAAVVTHMRTCKPGRYLISEVVKSLALSKTQTANLKDALKKGRSIVRDLELIDVSYYVDGRGRGAKSFLVKRT